jgi:hypothetical protein
MTRKQLAKLVEAWRKVLLPEWRVFLMDEPPPENSEDNDFWAICQTKDDYRELCVFFSDDCLERSARQVEITVVHELLHALTRPWRQQIDDVAFDLGNIRASALRELREHEEEQLVDRLAYVLVAQTHESEAFGTVERDE